LGNATYFTIRRVKCQVTFFIFKNHFGNLVFFNETYLTILFSQMSYILVIV
jgi:hypothetical protein